MPFGNENAAAVAGRVWEAGVGEEEKGCRAVIKRLTLCNRNGINNAVKTAAKNTIRIIQQYNYMLEHKREQNQ